jgi:hypothetical protein
MTIKKELEPLIRYPLLNSDDFISNFPAIWQKLSNIENIINLVNYANE